MGTNERGWDRGYTDIVARFTDQLAAETLAEFIASEGITCDVVQLTGPADFATCGVRVPRDRIEELKDVLKLTPVANRLTPISAQVIAGQLAREGVPCYVGGWHNFGANLYGPPGSDLQLDAKTTLRETNEPGYIVAVPASKFKDAMRVLNQSPISEAELTDLALRTRPNPEDPS
jgi:DNA polymerase III sliding clamp (beta) subunit (PCNA family)